MNSDNIKIVNYYSLNTTRFGHWVRINDYRYGKDSEGRKGRKNFIKFLETFFGPIGQRWQYQKEDNHRYLIKFDQEKDLLFFLLKIKQH